MMFSVGLNFANNLINKKTNIMYKLICTSYNREENKLVLRNNWTEEVEKDNRLMEILEQWKIPNDFKHPSKNSISEILEGEMNVLNVVIHVRILRFN